MLLAIQLKQLSDNQYFYTALWYRNYKTGMHKTLVTLPQINDHELA